jgi:hypothetical protein
VGCERPRRPLPDPPGSQKCSRGGNPPEVFLFDANGALVYHGTIDDNAEDAGAVKQHFLRDALESVASGQPVAVKETKVLGCGIKFYAS